MYPTVQDFLLCGTLEVPRLAHKCKTLVYPLPSLPLAQIVADMNGQRTVVALAVRHGVLEDALNVFIDELASRGVVLKNTNPTFCNVPIHLGPKEPWLAEVHIDFTDQCNLASHCPHCYRGDLLNKRKQHPLDDWKKVIVDLENLGVQRIAISGGEPLLRADLVDFIRYVTEHNILVSGIFTNGTIQNHTLDQVLDFLIAKGLHTSFYVSLDGPDAETNDRYRGKGSFQKSVGFLQRVGAVAQVSDLEVAVNSQINIYNVRRLHEWYEFLKTLPIHRWRMNAGRITGRLSKNLGLVVPPQELMDAYERVIACYLADWRKKQDPFKINIESVFRTEMLNKRRAYIFDPDLQICDYKQHACSIEPTGDVQFCTSWNRVHYGNVFREGMQEIWYNSELQKLKQMRLKDIVGCRDCKLLPYCGGGCRHMAPSLTEADPIACERYTLFVQRIVPLLHAEGVSFIV
ncbi:MAG: radical SAM protein [Patescibacteria group bacterium]